MEKPKWMTLYFDSRFKNPKPMTLELKNNQKAIISNPIFIHPKKEKQL